MSRFAAPKHFDQKSLLTQTAIVYVGGTGRHVAYWTEIMHQPEVLINWGKILFTIEQTYFLAVLFAKLAILAMYIRIFTSKPALYTSYVMAGILIAAWLGSAISGLVQCRPLWCAFDKSRPQECTCINILAFFRYISLPNIVTDSIMLVLPLPTIWRLKLTGSQKLGLTGAFLMGSLWVLLFIASCSSNDLVRGLVASCVRFAIFFEQDALADATWKTAYLSVWTVTEPGTYLIAACLPVLRPLVRRVRGKTSSDPPSRRSGGISKLEGRIPTSKYHNRSLQNKSISNRRGSESTSDKIDLIGQNGRDQSRLELSNMEPAAYGTNHIAVTSEFNVEYHDRN